jgi:hypothetical protein
MKLSKQAHDAKPSWFEQTAFEPHGENSHGSGFWVVVVVSSLVVVVTGTQPLVSVSMKPNSHLQVKRPLLMVWHSAFMLHGLRSHGVTHSWSDSQSATSDL